MARKVERWTLNLLPTSQVEVSPLENAIEVIENKNLQLRTLITQCQSRQMQNINPLTMCLNGVIDAAVNGGLARYQEVWMDGLGIRLEGFRDPGRSEAMTYSMDCLMMHEGLAGETHGQLCRGRSGLNRWMDTRVKVRPGGWMCGERAGGWMEAAKLEGWVMHEWADGWGSLVDGWGDGCAERERGQVNKRQIEGEEERGMDG